MQLLRYGSVGVIATLTHALVFIFLVELFDIRPVGAVVIAFLSALALSYFGHHRWTFNSTSPHGVQFIRFLLVALLGLGANVSITYLIVDVLFFWYGLALLLTVTAVPLLTFYLSKYWVFNR